MRILIPSAMRLEVLDKFIKATKALRSVVRELNGQCGGLVLIGRLKIWFQVVEFVPHTESTSQNHCAQLFFQRDPGRLLGQIFFIRSQLITCK